MTEDETVGWHHWVEGYVSEQASGVSDEQGSLVCCSPWGHKMQDTTQRLNRAVWKKKGMRNTFCCSGLWKFHTCDSRDNCFSPHHTHKCWIEIYFRKCTVIFLSKEEKCRRRKQKEKLNSTKGIVKVWIKSHLFVLLSFFFFWCCFVLSGSEELVNSPKLKEVWWKKWPVHFFDSSY